MKNWKLNGLISKPIECCIGICSPLKHKITKFFLNFSAFVSLFLYRVITVTAGR